MFRRENQSVCEICQPSIAVSARPIHVHVGASVAIINTGFPAKYQPNKPHDPLNYVNIRFGRNQRWQGVGPVTKSRPASQTRSRVPAISRVAGGKISPLSLRNLRALHSRALYRRFCDLCVSTSHRQCQRESLFSSSKIGQQGRD